MQFIETADKDGMQDFELDLYGFGFLGFSVPKHFKDKLIKIDLYLHEYGKASIRPALVAKPPSLTNKGRRGNSYRKVGLPVKN